ncbi:MAG: hypothetical protein HQK73_07830 [Desulfamplus sp.]|nr:hypothetical protein [Desulfamplus sp.]MBF0412957.1 hypothetical protein [Desulfamplus sp.]
MSGLFNSASCSLPQIRYNQEKDNLTYQEKTLDSKDNQVVDTHVGAPFTTILSVTFEY